jgi:Tol biopolymer transport system component
MNKRIFAISTLVLVLLIAAIFAYNFAFKKTPEQSVPAKTVEEGKMTDSSTPDAANQTKTSSPQSNGSSIVPVSENQVFGATLSFDENSLYVFAGDNGQLNQIDFTGKLDKVISTEEFKNIKKIFWNKQKTLAIVKRSGDQSKSKFLVLDIAQKKVTPLKDSVDTVAWSSLGDKIIYKYYDSGSKKRSLNVSDPNGSNWKKLTDIDFVGAEIIPVPASSNVSLWPSPDAFVATSINLIGFDGENKKEILKDRFGADLLWSPDGKIAAVSSTDQKGGKKTDLATMNPAGGQFQSISFPTFANKCVWSTNSKYLYCAMPGNISDSAILPNDWQNGKMQTADTFWKIEVGTGKKERLIEADKIGGSYDALDPFLSRDEKTLFFTNKVDGKLYKLGL